MSEPLAPAVPETKTQTLQQAFEAPGGSEELRVAAVLNYQKADAVFLDQLFGADAGVRTPVTRLAEDELTIRVVRQ